MISLQQVLPPISNQVWDREQDDAKRRQQKQIVALHQTAPPYGSRQGWLPRNDTDFGDGGAFPECHIAQYPSGVGKEANSKDGKGSTSNALAVQLDETGKIKYDVLARQGHSKEKIVYSKLTDLLPSAMTSESDPDLIVPDEEQIQEITDKTRNALEKLTQSKISSAMPVRCAEKLGPTKYIRYTPSQQGEGYNSGAKQRVIRMVEMPKDPMEPPRFRVNKKIPRGPPSPPAPVMHSPTRKVTVKEQQEWRIPPCISNWKNAKGYTIPLDKRLAADGRGLQPTHVNEKFNKLSDSLHIADKKAREQIDMRSQLERKMAQKEKDRKEDNLKMLAKKAREEQSGRPSGTSGITDESEREREKLRQERARERKRDNALSKAKASNKGKFATRERDITEQIALSLPQKTATGSEAMFDQRLFNQSRGMDSGFGDDEAYSVYDKAWRETVSQNIYRPTRNEHENFGLDQLENTNRFVPGRGFSGADSSVKRSGPVQFQPSVQSSGHEKEEEDLFGLVGLLSEAKNAGRRPDDSTHGKRKRRD